MVSIALFYLSLSHVLSIMCPDYRLAASNQNRVSSPFEVIDVSRTCARLMAICTKIKLSFEEATDCLGQAVEKVIKWNISIESTTPSLFFPKRTEHYWTLEEG